MASNPEDQHEKEGISMADVVKAAGVLGLERCTADRFLSGHLSSDEDGQYVRGVTVDWRDGFVWHRTKEQWQWKQEADYCR